MNMRPTLRVERRLFRHGATLIACVDEVGRGALAGPVTVGVVLLSRDTRRAPRGIRDSKLLSARAREELLPKIEEWVSASAVGHATAQEIDDVGIMTSLRMAALRALADLPAAPNAILLDGSHDFLSGQRQGVLWGGEEITVPQVTTVVRGDLRCTGIACASILAKCARDALMTEVARAHPCFDWERNKGYGTREHLEAIARYGPSPEHRRSWRLPT